MLRFIVRKYEHLAKPVGRIKEPASESSELPPNQKRNFQEEKSTITRNVCGCIACGIV